MDKNVLQEILEQRALKGATKGMCEAYDYCDFCEEPTSFLRRSSTPCADAYLNMKDINNMLKNYMTNKAKIATIKDRLEIWYKAIKSEDIMFIDVPESTLGMPKPKYKISSPVEKEIEYKEMDKKKIEEMIKSEESRLYSLERNIRKLDIVFNILPERDMFLIECKYFENMSWMEIEDNYNNKYKKKITEKRLRNKMSDIKKQILYIIKQNGTKVG